MQFDLNLGKSRSTGTPAFRLILELREQAAAGGAVGVGTGSTISVAECTFESNAASVEGGAFQSAGTLYLSSTTITRNVAQALRGGAVSTSGSLRITSCNLTHNAVLEAQKGAGGAVYSAGSTRLETTLFADNVGFEGGAIFSTSDLVVEDVNFTQNNASAGSGGAVFAKAGTAILQGATFYCNYAESSPSSTAVFADGSVQATVANSAFEIQKSAESSAGISLTDGGASPSRNSRASPA